jgi:hypothetical protein
MCCPIASFKFPSTYYSPVLLFLSTIKVMEKDRRRTNSRAPAMKASTNAAGLAGHKNRSQARRDRKMALQQDVTLPHLPHLRSNNQIQYLS